MGWSERRAGTRARFVRHPRARRVRVPRSLYSLRAARKRTPTEIPMALHQPSGRALRGLAPRHWALLALAALMLTGNYVFYLLGVKYTTPANAQLLIQAAPL